MHAAAPARYVSVSELYSADEVELLLEEIRELEPTSCRGEDLQDFEIAGSGALGGGGAGGGRSPAGTEHSWDSHAHYSRAPPPPPRPLAPLYCRLDVLASAISVASIIVVVCSLTTCICIWVGVGLRTAQLPLASRFKLLLFGALTSVLIHSMRLFVHISQLDALLPINWNKVAMWSHLWSGVTLTGGSLGALAAVLLAAEYRWTPPHLAALLLAAAGVGLGGAAAALVAWGRLSHQCWSALRPPAAPASRRTSAASAPPAPQAAYRAVPSTSRDNAL